LVLPHLDGFAVLERIRQRRELDDMPIVVISAIADVATVKKAYALGAVDFIAKPFNVDLLDAKLRTFLRLQKLQEQVRARQAFLQDVVDHLSSGRIVVDGTGVIVKVNAAACAMLARPAAELLGRRIAEALPGGEAMFLVSGDAAQRRVTVGTRDGQLNLGFTN